MGGDVGGFVFVVFALVGLPVLLTLRVTRKPGQIGLAFLVWYLALWLVLGGGSVSPAEGMGWTMIMGLFFSWIGVPLTALVLRILRIPRRFFGT